MIDQPSKPIVLVDAGTAALSIPKARLHPSPTAPCALSGSKYLETSASCGPVAGARSIDRVPYRGNKTGQLRCYMILHDPDKIAKSIHADVDFRTQAAAR